MKKYYEILGLEEGASKEEIEERYKKLSKELDPKNNDNQDFFKEEFKKIQEAYKVLIKDAMLTNSKVGNGKSESISESNNSEHQDNKIPENKENKKKAYIKEYIVIILLFSLLGHNFYLQTKLEGISDEVYDASRNASRAANNASDAASYASDAVSYASDAADYASQASSYAEDASSYARDAYYYSFGNQCSYCP